MQEDPNCVFCRIISSKLPSKVVAQNKGATAILDAFPLALGHILVISRSHRGKVQHLADIEAQALFELTLKAVAAVEEATRTAATTIAIHNGRDAGQEIPHVHVHIIPRREGDGAGPVHSMFHNRPVSSPEEMDLLCREISSRFS